jgi:hypothetical protein
MESVPVLMQLDAGISIPVGPLRLPLRAAALIFAASPLMIPLFALPFSTTVQVIAGVSLLGLAYIASVPTAEGLWIGTYLAYRLTDGLMPCLVDQGRAMRATCRRLPDVGLIVSRRRPALALPPPLHHWASLARVTEVDRSLFQRRPSGWCVLFELIGSEDPPLTPGHGRWAESVVGWVRAVGCAAQFVSTSDHLDSAAAARAFDAHHRFDETLLDDLERGWAIHMAESSLRVRNYVVLFPRLGSRSGIPSVCSPLRLSETVEASWEEAVRLRDLALRQALNLRLRIRAMADDEVQSLLEGTMLGAPSAGLVGGMLEMGAESFSFLAAARLPPSTFPGAAVSALARSQIRGGLTLYLCPVDSAEARKELRRQIGVYRELTRRSADPEAEALLAHTEELESRLMSRVATVFRAGLYGFASGHGEQASLEALEKLKAALEEERFQVERVTRPGLQVAQAVLPGGPPLRRNLLMIEESVAACLLPAAGTPFSDPTQPVLGVNSMVGSTVYHDTFRQPNHNALIAGQSGAGKSVACKTMLVRHATQGAKVVVIDPDNEYRNVVEILGGDYFELGEDALNAFDIPATVPAKEAAENIMGILSVMGGEEQDYVNFKAVRGLGGADKAWLEAEVVQFFEDFRAQTDRVPVLSDFVQYLEQVSIDRVRQFPRRAERCSEIVLRLKRFTQGRRAGVFDRPSSFDLTAPATGIGLYSLANQMGADLAPALAFVLTALLAELEARYLRGGDAQRLVILVDEAHWVLQDPEAGRVLERLLRQARKRGAGVWMASQSVHDFVTRSGSASPQPSLGEVLATSASTKLILGIQDAVAEGARTTFELSEIELQAITSRRAQGQGVLITDSERAIVHVMPGPVLSDIVFTTPGAVGGREGLPAVPSGRAPALPEVSHAALETADHPVRAELEW